MSHVRKVKHLSHVHTCAAAYMSAGRYAAASVRSSSQVTRRRTEAGSTVLIAFPPLQVAHHDVHPRKPMSPEAMLLVSSALP